MKSKSTIGMMVVGLVFGLGIVFNAAAASHTWTGTTGDGLASTAGNWDTSTQPTAADNIILDTTSQSNMTWDAGTDGLTTNVAGWNQDGYTGTVTLATALIVDSSGDFTVNDGILQTGQGTVTPITVDGAFSIGSNATVVVRRSSTEDEGAGQTITAGTVDIAGSLNADGQGFDGEYGPGAGTIDRGGSHGGQGANRNEGLPATTYGSVTNPTALGSGGRTTADLTFGGGAIVVVSSGAMTLDGTISANAAESGNRVGAGGSVNITATTLTGGGTIRANSTDGYLSGGGGRIAVRLTTGTDFGSMAFEAFAGTGTSGNGAAGTVYLKHAGHGAGRGDVIVDNNNLKSFPYYQFTELSEGGDIANDYAQITIRNKGNLRIRTTDTLNFEAATIVGESASGATLTLTATNGVTFPDPFTLGTNYTLCIDTPVNLPTADWTIPSGAVLSYNENLSTATRKLNLALAKLTIETGGAIDVDSKGFINESGPGAGNYNRGGSHGGIGGIRYESTTPAPTYGSVTNPLALGSGGREPNLADNGGGAVILSIANGVINNGLITANGANYSRGGSGGSINIFAATMTGSGLNRANGGSAYIGGGGGRIAVRLTSGTDFGELTFQAFGGTSGHLIGDGAAGTVYLETAADVAGKGIVHIDNTTRSVWAGITTELPPSYSGVDPLFVFNDDLSGTDLVITNNGSATVTADYFTIGDLLIPDANAYLTLGTNTLNVDSFEHDLADSSVSGPGNTDRVDNYDQIIWATLPSGTVIIIQ